VLGALGHQLTAHQLNLVRRPLAEEPVRHARRRLAEGDPAVIRGLMEECRRKRGTSQPLGKRNAGCIFKNPPGQSAGRLPEYSVATAG